MIHFRNNQITNPSPGLYLCGMTPRYGLIEVVAPWDHPELHPECLTALKAMPGSRQAIEPVLDPHDGLKAGS